MEELITGISWEKFTLEIYLQTLTLLQNLMNRSGKYFKYLNVNFHMKISLLHKYNLKMKKPRSLILIILLIEESNQNDKFRNFLTLNEEILIQTKD